MSRPYEIILLGATGYTGKYTAEAIAQHLPTDLRWAVSGRSESKLSSLVSEVKPLNPDRRAPDVLPCTLDSRELNALVVKTKVLINAVGPYHLYSEPIVRACAENGTHYIDCTGEVPWVKRMVEKYEDVAKRSGAIVCSSISFIFFFLLFSPSRVCIM
jgi:short subunit dehydrogenase-like uncharacterized protein